MVRNVQKGLLIVAWCVLNVAACPFAIGQEPGWETGFLASNDMVSGRLMRDFGGRVVLGFDVAWMDGIAAEEVEGWRFSFVGTYALIDEAPLKLPALGELPATWYIGGLGGALVPTKGDAKGDWDATAALTTGFVLGDKKAWIGGEYQYALTDDLWSQLAEIPDKHKLLFTVGVRWK